MRFLSLIVLLSAPGPCPAADLAELQANTFGELECTIGQPADADQKGCFTRAGWNEIIYYDRVATRILFYDRWVDKKHGGQTIYGNSLFAFDPASGKLTPVKIDNWTKKESETGCWPHQPGSKQR